MTSYPLTKIIATIGPSSFKPQMMKRLFKEGVSIARLNLSHGTLEEHQQLINQIRQISQELNQEISILLDLPGPKVRLGKLPQTLTITNQAVALYSDDKDSQIAKEFDSLPIPAIVMDKVKKGALIAIDDGRVVLKVSKKENGYYLSKPISGGEVTSFKGISVMGTDLPLDSLTKSDEHALNLAPFVDYIAISFVKNGQDLKSAKEKIAALIKDGQPKPLVVAKIETAAAISNLKEVVAEADALMVARGDLGLAVDPAQLGVLQKEIVKQARIFGKPVIVATQMLDSLMVRPLPNRSEVLDVTNAIIDNVDAVMLSGETAIGNYPKEAVGLMSSIALNTEHAGLRHSLNEPIDKTISTAHLFVHTLIDLVQKEDVLLLNEQADLKLAILLSRHRVGARQIVPFSDPEEARRFNLYWGVYPVISTKRGEELAEELVKNKIIRKNHKVIRFGWEERAEGERVGYLKTLEF